MLDFLKKLFTPVEEVTTTANELQSFYPNLSNKDAEHLALLINPLLINVGIVRDEKKDQAASSDTNI